MSGAIEYRFRLHLDGFELEADGEIASRGVTALFGRSGSGKTSLLRCIAGLERPDAAFLSVNGQCWHDSNRGIYLPPHQRAVGYVFQENALFPHMKVSSNLLYGFRRVPGTRESAEIKKVVEILGLKRLLQRYPHQLSGGEEQRVAIGRALLNQPRLLLMDEPLASLDRGRKREILPYLERLHEAAEIPIIYVTHDLEELVRIADDLILIEKGSIIARGEIEEMLSRIDLPISRDEDAGSVIDTRIIEHDEQFHLSRLAFAGGVLVVSQLDRPIGSEIRIRIHAKDVSLALEPPGPTSILNVLPARVESLAAHGRGRMIVRLNLSGVPILARITQKSQDNLGLKPGMQLYAQIKSVALSL